MKLRVSKALHARMRSRADAISVDLSELVRRCVKLWMRSSVAMADCAANATRAGSTVITLDCDECDYSDLRQVITWALDQTETQAEPLELESVDVEYVT